MTQQDNHGVGRLHAIFRPGRPVVGYTAAGVLLAALLITHPGSPASRSGAGRPLLTVVATTTDGLTATVPATVTSADQHDQIIQGDPNTTVDVTALADSTAGLTTISVTAGNGPPITKHAADAQAQTLWTSMDPKTGQPITVRFAPPVRGTAAYTTITVNATGRDGQTNRLRVYFLTRGLPQPSVDVFTASFLQGRSRSVIAHWSIAWCGEVPPGSCKVTIWYTITTAASTAPASISVFTTTQPAGTATIALGTAQAPLPADWTVMDWYATAESPASADRPVEDPPAATHFRFIQ